MASPLSSCQRLRNFASGLDEKLRDGAERAVLQADNSDRRARVLQLDGQDEAKLTAGLKFAKKTATVMTYEQYFRREEVCGACASPLQKPFVYLCIPSSRYVQYTSGILGSQTESAFLVPRMSAWRRNVIKRPLTRMPDEEIIYRFQLSRTLPKGTDTQSMIALNRTLYERARDIGGFRMTSSAVPMTQADWMRHYGPIWPTVQAAKSKYDPKNVLTPGHAMFPG